MFFLYMINYKTDVQCRLWGSVIMIACQYYSAIMLVISLFLRPFVVSFGVSPVPQLLCINPKETSWGLKGPVAYISYHCVSLKNRFLLKRYVFLKNIVLQNIMCETNWIVITTTFYR